MTLSWRIKRAEADAAAKFVVWETPGSDKMAPFDAPEEHLDRVWVSSTFDYLKIAHHDAHSLTHSAVSGKSTTLGSVTMAGQTVAEDQVLYTHGLGYTPRYMVAIDGHLIQNYHPVQTGTNQVRCASFYATSTAIHCINFGTSSGSALSAVTITYDLLLFRPPLDGVDPDLPIFSAKQGILANGLIKATDKLLRRSDDDDASPFDLNLGPAVDIDRGSAKWFLSDGSTLTFAAYAGSGVAPTSIQCAIAE